MSPKQMTRLGLIMGSISILGIIPILFFNPGLGFLNGWPILGLALALLLFIAAYAKGAYLTAQRRADMVDMLNDCYQGVEKGEEV